MKNKLVKALMVGMVFTTMFSSAIPVMARDMTIENPEVEKVLNVADGITVPQSVFSFTINKNTPDGPNLHIEDVTIAQGTENNDLNQIFGYGKILNEAGQILSKSDFPHAGVYEYTISEVNKGDYTSDISNDKISYDTRNYTFSINVVNTSDNGLDIASIIIKDNSINVDGDNDGKTTSITFNNTYEKTASLAIEKQTLGNYADRTKDFDFQITMTAPSTSDVKEFTGKIGEEVVTLQSGVQGTFKLHDDERLVFDSIPAGTVYTVSEVGAEDGYTAKVSVVSNGGEAVMTNADSEKAGVSTGESLVGEDTNTVLFENTLQDNPATGIIMNNLPFAVAGVVLIGGIAVYLGVKKKVTK